MSEEVDRNRRAKAVSLSFEGFRGYVGRKAELYLSLCDRFYESYYPLFQLSRSLIYEEATRHFLVPRVCGTSFTQGELFHVTKYLLRRSLYV